MPDPQHGRQRCGRRAHVAFDAPPGEARGCADRSRSLPVRFGQWNRYGDRVAGRLGKRRWLEEAEADSALQAGGHLRWVAAFRARNHVCGGGWSEAQPADWAANVVHHQPPPETARVTARPVTCFATRACVGAVAMANRLSAPLPEDIARKARRARTHRAHTNYNPSRS